MKGVAAVVEPSVGGITTGLGCWGERVGGQTCPQAREVVRVGVAVDRQDPRERFKHHGDTVLHGVG